MLLLLPWPIVGCGDDGGGAGTDAATETEGTSGSGSGSTGSSAGTTAGGTTAATTDGSSGTTTTSTSTSTSTTGTTGGGTAGACSSVVVTYDLTGTKINIDAIQDFEITVQEPYDDDHNTGPGTMKIRFVDDGGGNPAPGSAQIVEYNLVQNFVTGSPGLATVTTDLDTWSGPDGCGTAVGVYGGDVLTWDDPAQMDPYCRDGTVSCTGAFCGMAGSPPENMPFVFDNDCSEPHPLNPFTFQNGIDSFTSSPVVVAMDNNQTVTVTFTGTAIATEVDPNTPACACP
ncbi:MAG: hypothetical protein D6705_18040 [Deltaproteobacteria bacterium]|nr:MAG: hypothetical protein D6705_18040 [Deltaproteobacteria bacterium]